MSENAWTTDVIDYMAGPVGDAEFFRDYHEKKALIALRKDPERYTSLLSLERIDELVASMDFEAGTLDMTRADPPVHREDYTFSNGMVDRGAIARHFQNGATLILPQLHSRDATLAEFCRAVEARFSCHTQTNIYLTPPDAQGFKTHYDDHDVFVLQVSGSKSWRLYDTPVENPYRGEGFQPGAHEVGEPVEEFVLHAGDCAYVPRGLMHDALTHGDEASLHITVGLIVKTWADLMLEAVSEVALHNPTFRKSLPAGFGRPDFDRTEAQQTFKELVHAIAKDADLDASLDLFTDNFIRSRTPTTSGTISGFETPKSEDQAYALRPLAPWRFAEDGEEVVIITSGGEVRFPAAAEPALHTLLDGGQISMSDFDALTQEQRQESIEKLFAYGLVVPIG